MRIGKFRRRIVSKSPFSDDEKPDARDDDDAKKVSSLTEEDEQKEDDIARAKSRVNPRSLRMLLRIKGVVPRRIVLRHFHERFPIAWTKRNAYTTLAHH